MRQALCLHPGKRLVWPASVSRDDPADNPSCGAEGVDSTPAGTGQGYSQPRDLAGGRALRSRALPPSGFIGTDRGPA